MGIFSRTPSRFTISTQQEVDQNQYAAEVLAAYAKWPYRTGALVEVVDISGIQQGMLIAKQWSIKRGEIGIVITGRLWSDGGTIIVAFMRDGDFYGVTVEPEKNVIPFAQAA